MVFWFVVYLDCDFDIVDDGYVVVVGESCGYCESCY